MQSSTTFDQRPVTTGENAVQWCIDFSRGRSVRKIKVVPLDRDQVFPDCFLALFLTRTVSKAVCERKNSKSAIVNSARGTILTTAIVLTNHLDLCGIVILAEKAFRYIQI